MKRSTQPRVERFVMLLAMGCKFRSLYNVIFLCVYIEFLTVESTERGGGSNYIPPTSSIEFGVIFPFIFPFIYGKIKIPSV